MIKLKINFKINFSYFLLYSSIKFIKKSETKLLRKESNLLMIKWHLYTLKRYKKLNLKFDYIKNGVCLTINKTTYLAIFNKTCIGYTWHQLS